MNTEAKAINIENLFKNGWAGLHDAIVDALDAAPSLEQAVELFEKLPDHIQEKAFKWGLNDSEVRDECFEAINDLFISEINEEIKLHLKYPTQE